MLHKNRRWCVTPVASAEELAEKLTEMTWCGCSGFRLGGYLWLNDATSPDGAQEFAVYAGSSVMLCSGVDLFVIRGFLLLDIA